MHCWQASGLPNWHHIPRELNRADLPIYGASCHSANGGMNMADPDDETTRSARRFQPGQDLYGISVGELEQIAQLL